MPSKKQQSKTHVNREESTDPKTPNNKAERQTDRELDRRYGGRHRKDNGNDGNEK